MFGLAVLFGCAVGFALGLTGGGGGVFAVPLLVYSFMIGNIKFVVLRTPGHTPESISFLLTDQGGHANKPMGIFTGDFVFVGSIGRPDLLEEAAGLADTAEPGARDLFQSAERFKQLPDHRVLHEGILIGVRRR